MSCLDATFHMSQMLREADLTLQAPADHARESGYLQLAQLIDDYQVFFLMGLKNTLLIVI